MKARLLNALRKTIADNTEALFGLGVTIVVSLICNEFHIPITIGRSRGVFYTTDTLDTNAAPIRYIPRNSEEAAVLAILKSAKKLFSASSKRNAADRIHDIAVAAEHDETKAMAAAALSAIADEMYADENKNHVLDLISDIT